MKDEIKSNDQPIIFQHRLDFYWKFLMVYGFTLIAYILFVVLVLDYHFTQIVKDPVVILLIVFILVSGIGLLINLYKNREIIIGKDFITFKNRFVEKTYKLDDLSNISFGKEKSPKIHGDNRIVKIKVKDRRRVFRIKPNTFWNDRKLIKSIANLKKEILERK
jgi:cell division protein FtsL